MSAERHRAAARAVGLLLTGCALCLAGCGAADDDGAGGAGDGFTVGLLLPENQTPRYETSDRPLIEEEIRRLCPACSVEYANARDDPLVQHQQVNAMISNGVEVLILDAVEPGALRAAVEAAEAAGIPVIAYDRPVEGPVTAMVSFDASITVALQARMLAEALGDRLDGARIVRVEGPLILADITGSELAERARISMYQAPAWNAENAYAITTGAIAAHGPENIDGVLAATDILAAGVIPALRDAGLGRLPPVTGQDATLGAVRSIVEGEQYLTIYKPFGRQAAAAAEVAVSLGRGQGLPGFLDDGFDTATRKDIPALLLTPVAVTADNVKETIVADGFYTVDEICTPAYRRACARVGLIEE
ncbi:substrate-binding domain-containing protein [Streptomyces sp. URMC 129]|uniref:substrate-binding domain-containing protein n=1 Tax=Streptomyces sp. URMC 129 TaxID=3423407 RepID=UPI003F1A27C5